jgi:hypothetical protein
MIDTRLGGTACFDVLISVTVKTGGNDDPLMMITRVLLLRSCCSKLLFRFSIVDSEVLLLRYSYRAVTGDLGRSLRL